MRKALAKFIDEAIPTEEDYDPVKVVVAVRDWLMTEDVHYEIKGSGVTPEHATGIQHALCAEALRGLHA